MLSLPLSHTHTHTHTNVLSYCSIFDAHARKYETEYLEDMRSLGVMEPDVLTRVTEYVPNIIAFVQKIVAKDLAYAYNGSVYLSIDAFKASGHSYKKLMPFDGDTRYYLTILYLF